MEPRPAVARLEQEGVPVTMTTQAAAPGPLGPWVEAHTETCRGGSTYRVLVNHRTGQLIELSAAEAETCQQLGAGEAPGDSDDMQFFLAELRERGFLASDPPPLPRRTIRLSGARLDLRWTGAQRLVTAAYRAGARHLFRPAAVAAQVLLALAGLAALLAAVTADQRFALRVSPVQVPVVIGLSLAAVGVHELAHALVVIRHGRTVDAAGIRLHLGTPAFYVESASAVLLTRRQRLIQAGAGVWAEWQFTSVIAVLLWLAPLPDAAMVHRFVILNAATIGTNLLPFTGLDGSWLLADAVGVPDLSRRARGAVTRLITAVAARQPRTSGDYALAAYAALNGLVAVSLLLTAGFFWYQLFGGLVGTLASHGPLGLAALAVAAVVLARPAVAAAAAQLPAAASGAAGLCDAISFRLQWRWRIPATEQLAFAHPELGRLTSDQLGILAGQLSMTRHRGQLPAGLAGSYGIVRAGTATAAYVTGQPLTLAGGATWGPRHQLCRAARRATLVHVDATAVRQLLNEA
jgi:hypothetical protein